MMSRDRKKNPKQHSLHVSESHTCVEKAAVDVINEAHGAKGEKKKHRGESKFAFSLTN